MTTVPSTLAPSESQRLAEIRERAAKYANPTLDKAGVSDERALDSLAWIAGCEDAAQANLAKWVAAARRARWSWRAIADAMGEGGDEAAGRRVAARYRGMVSE